MSRLNKDRQEKYEPIRIDRAVNALMALGIEITFINNTRIEFYYREALITYYPYSGWASGKTIKDGRGLENLLKQLK